MTKDELENECARLRGEVETLRYVMRHLLEADKLTSQASIFMAQANEIRFESLQSLVPSTTPHD